MMYHSNVILPGFVGRARELAVLREELDGVRRNGQGRLLVMRGRRRVGKSWLAEEFVLRERAPHVYFTATRNAPDGDLARFAEALGSSTLPEVARASGVTFRDWESALAAAANGASAEAPSVIVIDEFPYLEGDDERAGRRIESLFSAAWERRLARLPVLVVLIGSDLAMMERLTEYGRPLYDRISRTLVLDALSPADIAEIAGLSPEDAIDAYAVIGGLPAFAGAWRRAGNLRGFLRAALAGSDTPFINAALRILDAEFPEALQARTILAAVGHGERTMRAISDATGISTSNLARPIRQLTEAKRIVRVAHPYGGQALNAPRYSVADPYLRFWLRCVQPELPAIERLRTEEVVERILGRWPEVRGQLVEPIVRDALERILPDDRLPGATHVGSWWTRSGAPQVDLVGGDRPASPTAVAFVGSIKWRERRPFAADDLEQLLALAAQVPGVTPATASVAISRSGVEASARKLTLAIGAADLVHGWSAPDGPAR